jgi:hypothetical protein
LSRILGKLASVGLLKKFSVRAQSSQIHWYSHKGIFRSKKEEVTGKWIKVRCDELHKFFSSPDISVMIESMTKLCVGNRKTRGKIVSSTRPMKKRLFGDLGRHEMTIDIGRSGMNGRHLAQDRVQLQALLNTLMIF